MYETIAVFIQSGKLFRVVQVGLASLALSCLFDMIMVILVTFYLSDWLDSPDEKDS